jgi:hypothetical protein
MQTNVSSASKISPVQLSNVWSQRPFPISLERVTGRLQIGALQKTAVKRTLTPRRAPRHVTRTIVVFLSVYCSVLAPTSVKGRRRAVSGLGARKDFGRSPGLPRAGARVASSPNAPLGNMWLHATRAGCVIFGFPLHESGARLFKASAIA